VGGSYRPYTPPLSGERRGGDERGRGEEPTVALKPPGPEGP